MKDFYLSYLMGAENITDNDIETLGASVEQKMPDGDRTLKIPQDNLPIYVQLIKDKLNNGFWNEVIGTKEILFIFKLKDGSIKEYSLNPENEKEIDNLCAKFNNEPEGKTKNVYKYISENSFYHDFMLEHYSDLVNR